MRLIYPLFFLLILGSGSAMTIGVSPDEIELDRHSSGSFWIINQNLYPVWYDLESSVRLSRSSGKILPESMVRIGVQSTKDSEIIVKFSQELGVEPSLYSGLRISVLSYDVTVKEGIRVMGSLVIGGLGLLGMLYLFFLAISSGFRFR